MSKKNLDLVCLSHLRWGFVYQRPQHLLSRAARDRRVFFFEEPVFDSELPRVDVRRDAESGVYVCVPHVPGGQSSKAVEESQQHSLDQLLAQYDVQEYLLWYYTPMALAFSRQLKPGVTLYDCMDELSAFAGAPPILRERETELMRRADVMFTGGYTLYEAKREKHHNVHAFPSSVEVEHFRQARQPQPEPADLAGIPRPRIGFCGVIDERLDIQLVRGVAERRPDWHFVMIGPVAKIDPATLPKLPNIHYLGGKGYKELPAYMSGWDAAILPFAHNESTRFISPTKTPEYLAAGLPVVSTSIRDVVRPYGEKELVRIADDADSFTAALEAAMRQDAPDPAWRERVEAQLALNSWDLTWERMQEKIRTARDVGRLPSLAAAQV